MDLKAAEARLRELRAERYRAVVSRLWEQMAAELRSFAKRLENGEDAGEVVAAMRMRAARLDQVAAEQAKEKGKDEG